MFHIVVYALHFMTRMLPLGLFVASVVPGMPTSISSILWICGIPHGTRTTYQKFAQTVDPNLSPIVRVMTIKIAPCLILKKTGSY